MSVGDLPGSCCQHELLVAVSTLPAWAQTAFQGYKCALNSIYMLRLSVRWSADLGSLQASCRKHETLGADRFIRLQVRCSSASAPVCTCRQTAMPNRRLGWRI